MIPILPFTETNIKKSFQDFKSMADAWMVVGRDPIQLYLSQGASEEARTIDNRIGSIKSKMIRF